jgi:hypothetical protein
MGLYDVLICAPAFDWITALGVEELKKLVIPYVKARSPPLILSTLLGADATRTNLESTLKTVDPFMVWIESHGSETRVVEGVIKVDNEYKTTYLVDLDNAGLFAGRIVFILACLCGRQLAPAMVDAGAKAVLAFTDTVVFEVRWVDDKPVMTEPFQDILYRAPATIFDHLTVGQVYDKMIERCIYWADCFRVWDPIARDAIVHDRDALAVFGDPSAKIPSTTELVATTGNLLATATFAVMAFQVILIGMLRALIRRK